MIHFDLVNRRADGSRRNDRNNDRRPPIQRPAAGSYAKQQTQPNTTENQPSSEERPTAARRQPRDIDEAEAQNARNGRPVGAAWYYRPT